MWLGVPQKFLYSMNSQKCENGIYTISCKVKVLIKGLEQTEEEPYIPRLYLLIVWHSSLLFLDGTKNYATFR